MSEPSRQFTLDVAVPATGTALVNCLGPIVESWNRRHNRDAALTLTSKLADGVALGQSDSYKQATHWELGFCMQGPQVSDEKIAEVSSLMLATIWEKMGLTQPSANDPMDVFYP